MKIAPFVEKLNSSQVYKDFLGKYGDAYLVAGFFVLDLESGNNIHQIDYYLPNEKKIAAFTLDKEVKVQVLDVMDEKSTPKELDIKTKIDLDELIGIVKDEMHNRGMTQEIKKLIAVIQNQEGEKVWNVNCVLSGMDILKTHIEDQSKSVLKMERISMFDIVKTIPKKMLGGAGNLGAEGGEGSPKPSKKQLKKQLEALNKIEDELVKEKAEINKELGGTKGKEDIKSKSNSNNKIKENKK